MNYWNLKDLDPEDVKDAYKMALDFIDKNCLIKQYGKNQYVAVITERGMGVYDIDKVATYWSEMFNAYMDHYEDNTD